MTASAGGAITIAGCGVAGPIARTYSICIYSLSHCDHFNGIIESSGKFN